MVRRPYGRRPAAASLVLAATTLISSVHANELVLLDFWSPNCGPCMQMKPTVQSLRSAGYPVREIDVSREPQLARDFQIDRIPCFVMMAGGQEVDRVVGATSTERLVQMFDRARVRMQSPDASQPVVEGQSIPWTGAVESPSHSAPVQTAGAAAVEPSGVPAYATQTIAPADPTSEGALLSATVRLRVQDAKGQSNGTGTIIDARSGEALVITCGHIFRESKGQGPVSVELFEAAPGGVRVVGQVPGQVLCYDLERDVALLSIRPNRPVNVAPVAPPRTAIARGDRAIGIGCSNGADPTPLHTRITSLDRYQGPPNIQASGAPVEGRSGGGLFNADGQLIGVCFAADYEGNEGLYAGLESIHHELDRLGLQEIYMTPVEQQALADRSGAAPVVRGQEPLVPVAPLPAQPPAEPSVTVAVAPSEDPDAMPSGLSAAEQAAWEEIMSRAATREVICIIRPKEPGGQSEVITLDNVSVEFVRALASRQRAADNRLPR